MSTTFQLDLGWITASQIYWTILTCLWIEYLFELYLCIRQNKVYKEAKEIPKLLQKTLDKETFEKARAYGKDRNRFTIFSEFYGMIILTLLLSFEGLYHGWKLTDTMLKAFTYWPPNWNVEIGRSIAFFILGMIFNNVVGLPLSIYSTFVLEEKHGFNKQTVGFFIKDFIKKNLVTVTLMSPFIGLIVKIVQAGGPYFFIWLWAFCFVVLIFLMTIYPVVIAPLFDKYTPLNEGPLKTRIESLAAKIKFPLTKLYVVEGSKRSAHSNAYLYGFFNNKRIVLFDTLIKGYVKPDADKNEKDQKEITEEEIKKKEEQGCSDEEIEAVLGHELGHWKLSHVLKNIVISQVNLLLIFATFGFFYQSSVVYEAFGFPRSASKPIILGLIIVLQFLLQIYNTAMGYLMNVLSRKFEYEADAFAVDLGYSEDLKGALIKLNKDNLGFPVSDPLYSAWHHSHPTLLQRLNAMDRQAKKAK